MLLDFKRADETWLSFAERVEPINLWWVLPDDMAPPQYQKHTNQVQGVPHTINITTAKETFPMTEAVQRFLFAINPGLPASAFADTYDTWNKGTKIRDSANFITGERLDAGLPIYPADLLMGCNVFRDLRRFAWTGGMGIPIGTDVLEIETINPNNLPNPLTLPIWLKQHLTIILPTIYADRKKINPYDKNGGGRNGGEPCYTAMLAIEPLYIEVARCSKVDGIVPNPYNPEWEW